MKKLFQRIFKRASIHEESTPKGKQFKKLQASLSRVGTKIKKGVHKPDIKRITAHAKAIRWSLVVLTTYLAAKLTALVLGVFIEPKPLPPPPMRPIVTAQRETPREDYSEILRRNMFNVEGKIPESFDQTQFDCLSQAKPSRARLDLLATIVMADPSLSVALVQESGNPTKIAVKPDESFFDGKYQALKIARGKLCFQVKASQDLEFIEVPLQPVEGALGAPNLTSGKGGEGIRPTSDTQFEVDQNFLNQKLENLTDILQSARAVPYIESGQFKGFLIQSIDQDSIFKQLGVSQGDILLGVNDIVLDNAGKGLEAFQRLRNAPSVNLRINRGGQEMTLNYQVRQ